jgi:hypothetical protein
MLGLEFSPFSETLSISLKTRQALMHAECRFDFGEGGGVLRVFATLWDRFGSVVLLPQISIHVNEPVENHQVGNSGYSDKAEIGLPDDCPEHYQEESYIT